MRLFSTLSLFFVLALALTCCTQANPQANRVSSAPPKVGEAIDDVVRRLGAPESKNFESLQEQAKYVTSYTDKAGTIHHITVEDGKITRVVYTDSR